MAAVRFDSMLTKAFGAITNSYTTLGTPTRFNWRMFKITNNTDGDLIVSFNGTADNIFVPKNGFTLYDMSTNALAVGETDEFVLSLQTQFYVKYSTAPTTGAVWVEGAYAGVKT
jgi:hypothetical protein